MSRPVANCICKHRNATYPLLQRYLELGNPLLLRSDVVDLYMDFVKTEPGSELVDTPLHDFMFTAQEAVVQGSLIAFAFRPRRGGWEHLLVQVDEMRCRDMSVPEFLGFKEGVVADGTPDHRWKLEIDLGPFERGFPRLRESRSIGRGVEFLNRHLSNRMFEKDGEGGRRLFEFLTVHQVRGRQLLVRETMKTQEELSDGLGTALEYLESVPPDSTWEKVGSRLGALGFEPGWGRTSAQIADTMGLLVDILEAPSAGNLERFLRRIPMIFSIVILSPHGYFGQAGVLGKPDTGGQVVYILDQVRALEAEMRRSIHNQGLDVEPRIVVVTRLIPESEGTSVNQPLEPIIGTEHAVILRVPFRDGDGEIVPRWISRFKVWPYLESFAREAEQAVLAELGGRPALIIGNYSDGNLVAALMAQSLGVTQCNIAHALEKTKYLHSDLYWRDHENDHHFATQYTADLISMNTADFIITSTYQEIAGTKNTVGQYESYRSYSLPGLYRVVNGIDVYDPKFNIVAPGADPNIFFPFTENDRRIQELRDRIETMVFGGNNFGPARGLITRRDRPLLFTMARLDVIKNISGFLEWYARSPELQEEANLLLVGGHLAVEDSLDAEESGQIERMHQIFDEYSLDDRVRWIPMQSDKTLVGELYRFVADTGGAFVQPALFEAFGLTVIESMTSGLPTFATCYGGPLESIEDGVSGFHIDPNHGDEAARKMASFFADCRTDPEIWTRISEASLRRVGEHYTWKRYATRLLALSRIYGFWKFISNIEREETRRYLDMFFGLMYRPLAIASGDDDRS